MPTEIRSAALSQAERTIKELQEENAVLKRELSETKSLYRQLVTENESETFDERRVMLLKSQLIQMERQVLLLTEALGSRAATLLEVENSISFLADTCRSLIAVETHCPEVPVKRAQLTRMVENAESARIKLYKNLENKTTENMAKPLLMMETFLKPHHKQQPVTMLDVCSGKTDHINLKQVAKLETKLVGVYKSLSAVQHSIKSVMSIKSGRVHVSEHLDPVVYERMNGQISKACSQLREVNMELVELSMLVPAAPWPSLQKSRIKEITVEDVLAKLPKFPRNKQADVKHLVESLLKAMNFTLHVSSLEGDVLKDEMKFHQSVHDLQLAYLGDLFKVIEDGYASFQESTQELLVIPLTEILSEYSELKETTSEDSLRTFLKTFKQHAEQIETAVETLRVSEEGENEGVQALSLFGERFFKSLNKEKKVCQEKRDSAVGELDVVKKQREEFLAELEQELKARPEIESDAKLEYEKIVSGTLDDSIIEEKRTEPEVQLKSNEKDDCQCSGKKVSPNRVPRQKLTDLKRSPKCCDEGSNPGQKPSVKKEKENMGLGVSGKDDKDKSTPTRAGIPKSVRKSSIPVDRSLTRTPVHRKGSADGRLGPGSFARSPSGSREQLTDSPTSANTSRSSVGGESRRPIPGVPVKSLNLKRDT